MPIELINALVRRSRQPGRFQHAVQERARANVEQSAG